jgi:hypothetical protein
MVKRTRDEVLWMSLYFSAGVWGEPWAHFRLINMRVSRVAPPYVALLWCRGNSRKRHSRGAKKESRSQKYAEGSKNLSVLRVSAAKHVRAY